MTATATSTTRGALLAGLAGGAGAALACMIAWAAPARAQLAVTDPGATAQLIQQVQAATNTINVLQQQYNKLQQTYEALSHPTSVAGLFPGLSLPSVQNPLGNLVPQVPGIVGGTNPGDLAGLTQQFLAQNRLYQPQATDPAAQEMNRQAQATAGIQALAYQSMQATQERMQQLPEIRAQLDGASTLQDVAAVNNRLQVEQQFVSTQQVQVQQLALLQQAQQQVAEQRVQQRQRQDADALFNSTKPLN